MTEIEHEELDTCEKPLPEIAYQVVKDFNPKLISDMEDFILQAKSAESREMLLGVLIDAAKQVKATCDLAVAR